MFGLPTDEEIKQLPARAIVAYAARCLDWATPVVVPESDSIEIGNLMGSANQSAREWAAGSSSNRRDSLKREAGDARSLAHTKGQKKLVTAVDALADAGWELAKMNGQAENARGPVDDLRRQIAAKAATTVRLASEAIQDACGKDISDVFRREFDCCCRLGTKVFFDDCFRLDKSFGEVWSKDA